MGKDSNGLIDNFSSLAQLENIRLVQALRQKRQNAMDTHENLKLTIARANEALEQNAYEFRALNQAYCAIMDAGFRRNCREAAEAVDTLQSLFSSYKDQLAGTLAMSDWRKDSSYDSAIELVQLKQVFLHSSMLDAIGTAIGGIEKTVIAAAGAMEVSSLSEVISRTKETLSEIRARQLTTVTAAWRCATVLRDLMEEVLTETSEVTDEIGYQLAVNSPA